MMIILSFMSVVKKVFRHIELLWVRMRYDEYSIENYFRKKGVNIGKGNRIYINSFGSEPHLVTIGDHCTITSAVRFINHDGGTWIFRKEVNIAAFGEIKIKDNCFIGVNSIILPNVIIGPNSVVGAGSVVTKDVPPDTVVAGVPARPICSIEEYKIKLLRRMKAFDASRSH